MAWLDTALLRYVNSDPDHSVIEGKTHWGIVFHKTAFHRSKIESVSAVAVVVRAVLAFALWDHVKPVQLCLCGLVGRSVTTVREL